MYHRSKNYMVGKAFIQTGLAKGASFASQTAVFMANYWMWTWALHKATGFEEGQEDETMTLLHQIIPGTCAGASSGMLFTAYRRLWRSTRLRVWYWFTYFSTLCYG